MLSMFNFSWIIIPSSILSPATLHSAKESRPHSLYTGSCVFYSNQSFTAVNNATTAKVLYSFTLVSEHVRVFRSALPVCYPIHMIEFVHINNYAPIAILSTVNAKIRMFLNVLFSILNSSSM